MYKSAVILFFCVLFCSNEVVKAQKNVNYINQTWLGYFNQTRLSNKWGYWADVHLRTKEDFFSNYSQSIIRLGGTYYLNDKVKLTAGYAHITNFPSDNHPTESQIEHRPWQQIQWHTPYGKNRMMQWIRFEERYRQKIASGKIVDGFDFNYRVRYNLMYIVPLSAKGIAKNTLSLVVNDEVHINLGKEIGNNTFDQNRFFAGIAYNLNSHDNLQFGFSNVFQQLKGDKQYRSNSLIRLFYFQNIDWRKK
jgi:Protein of unknown function (DUF2490)